MVRESEEVKTSFLCLVRREITAHQATLGKGVIDTGCSRFLIDRLLSKSGNRCSHEDGA